MRGPLRDDGSIAGPFMIQTTFSHPAERLGSLTEVEGYILMILFQKSVAGASHGQQFKRRELATH